MHVCDAVGLDDALPQIHASRRARGRRFFGGAAHDADRVGRGYRDLSLPGASEPAGIRGHLSGLSTHDHDRSD